jgi:flagellar biosynthesis/type III secretory pathway protein FliH
MYEEILSMLKPHVANRTHAQSLAVRLDEILQDKIEAAYDRGKDEGRDEGWQDGYDDGVSDGASEGWQEGYDTGVLETEERLEDL